MVGIILETDAGSAARVMARRRRAARVQAVDTLRRLWHQLARLDPRLWDVLLAVIFASAAATQAVHDGYTSRQHIISAVGTGLPLAWRRRFPNGVYLAQVAFAIFGAREPGSISLLATFVGLFSAAVYSRWRWVPLMVPMIGALTLGVLVPQSYPSVPAWGLELIGGLSVWLAGNAVRQQRAQAEMLAERCCRPARRSGRRSAPAPKPGPTGSIRAPLPLG